MGATFFFKQAAVSTPDVGGHTDIRAVSVVLLNLEVKLILGVYKLLVHFLNLNKEGVALVTVLSSLPEYFD